MKYVIRYKHPAKKIRVIFPAGSSPRLVGPLVYGQTITLECDEALDVEVLETAG